MEEDKKENEELLGYLLEGLIQARQSLLRTKVPATQTSAIHFNATIQFLNSAIERLKNEQNK